MPRVDYKERVHLTNSIVPGLDGEHHYASRSNTILPPFSGLKIDVLEEEKKVKKLISKAFCEEGNIENNGEYTHPCFAVICDCCVTSG